MRTFRGVLRVVSATVFLTFIAAGSIRAVTITVDEQVEHQTIEGFGAHGAMNVWWSSGPFYNDNFLNLIVNDLGLSMIRNEYYPDNEKASSQLPYLKALHSKAQSSGKEVRFIFSIWSPPPRWKYCESGGCPDAVWNRLSNGVGPGYDINGVAVEPNPEYGGKGNHYPDYANYLVSAVDWYKNQVGVDLYALSFANEPDFAQSFNSCVWAAEQYRDFVKELGPKLDAKYPNVKIFGAERMLRDFGETCAKTLLDPAAAPHLDVVAVHGYSDGVAAENLSQLRNYWGGQRSVRTFIHGGNPAGKKMSAWMTETSGYELNFGGAMELARSIHCALVYGDVSAWVWWQLGEKAKSDPSKDVYCLMHEDQPTVRYYASKHFYRWIRPDAVRIDCASPDTTIEVSAYHHKGNKTLTLVLINTTGSSKDITLSGNQLPSTFDVYRSTSGQNCARISDMSGNGTLSLPANSITTLYGSGYNPPAVSTEPGTLVRRRPVCADAEVTGVYDILGRRMAHGADAGARAAGLRLERFRMDGKPVAVRREMR